MSFEEISDHEPGKPGLIDASITLVARGGNPNALVSIGSRIGSKLKWKNGGEVALQLGRGVDTGKMRLVAKPGGVFVIKRMRHPGTWQVGLGFIPEFGTKPAKNKRTTARLLSPEAVEIDLPTWGVETAREDGPALAEKAELAAQAWADEARTQAPRNNAPAASVRAKRLPPTPQLPDPEPPPAPPQPPVASKRICKDGVELTLLPLPAEIGHYPRGAIRLTQAQSLFLWPLVRGFDALIPVAQITAQTGLRSEEITWAECDIGPALRTIGLQLLRTGPFYKLRKV